MTSTAYNNAPWLAHYDPGVPASLEYPSIPVYELLDGSASKFPERPCANFYGRRITYRSMKTLTDRLAASFIGIGLKRGEHVVLLLPNSPQFMLAYYGLLKAGLVVAALNPLASEDELAFLLSHSDSKTAITIPLFLEKTAAAARQAGLKRVFYSRLADFMPFPLSLAQGWREHNQVSAALRGVDPGRPAPVDFKALLNGDPPPGFRPEPADPDDLAVLIYSGGTTGAAKGVMLSHRNLVANAYQMHTWGNLSEEDKLLAVLPFFHGYGMSVNMNLGVLTGGELVLVPRFKAKEAAHMVRKYRTTFFTGVPTIFAALGSLPGLHTDEFASLKGMFVGAAPLTQALKESFEARTGGRMIEGYGLTESVTAIMANPLRGQHKTGSIGLPFSDVEVKIVGLEGKRPELPPGEIGEIVLRSPTVMLGYYKQPEESGRTVVDGWLYTGDIGYMDGDGYFYITDRVKDIIKVGGFLVYPREIDELIARHPKVKEGIAVGLPDPYSGERIKAYIILKEGETATEEELIAYFRQHLAHYKAPTEVEFRDELPHSIIGKILRRALLDEQASRAVGSERA